MRCSRLTVYKPATAMASPQPSAAERRDRFSDKKGAIYNSVVRLHVSWILRYVAYTVAALLCRVYNFGRRNFPDVLQQWSDY
eukprot:259905-Chlamydomonas_euryale.AAC.1